MIFKKTVTWDFWNVTISSYQESSLFLVVCLVSIFVSLFKFNLLVFGLANQEGERATTTTAAAWDEDSVRVQARDADHRRRQTSDGRRTFQIEISFAQQSRSTAAAAGGRASDEAGHRRCGEAFRGFAACRRRSRRCAFCFGCQFGWYTCEYANKPNSDTCSGTTIPLYNWFDVL